MNTFQAIYIACCIPMALLDFSDLYAKYKLYFPVWVMEATIVVMIISWPVWFLPAWMFFAWARRRGR